MEVFNRSVCGCPSDVDVPCELFLYGQFTYYDSPHLEQKNMFIFVFFRARFIDNVSITLCTLPLKVSPLHCRFVLPTLGKTR